MNPFQSRSAILFLIFGFAPVLAQAEDLCPPTERIVLDTTVMSGVLESEFDPPAAHFYLAANPKTKDFYRTLDTATNKLVPGFKSYFVLQMTEAGWVDLIHTDGDLDTLMHFGIYFPTNTRPGTRDEKEIRFKYDIPVHVKMALVPDAKHPKTGVYLDFDLSAQYLINMNLYVTGKLFAGWSAGDENTQTYMPADQISKAALNKQIMNLDAWTGVQPRHHITALIPMDVKMDVTRTSWSDTTRVAGRSKYVRPGFMGPYPHVSCPVGDVAFSLPDTFTVVNRHTTKKEKPVVVTKPFGPATTEEAQKICMMIEQDSNSERRLCWALKRNSTGVFKGECPIELLKNFKS